MLDHYLALGGNEIVNSERAYGYATTSDCPVDWLEDPECDTLAEVQGDEQYEYANIQSAPWFDPDDPETTSRFLGLYGIDIRNLSDSTRTASVTEKTTAGAQVSGYRHASREVRVRGWMTAEGDDALEAGMTWLRNALEPNACGMHGGNCGESDSAFFVACPPERRLERLYTPWEVRSTNLATNPSFETTSGTVEVRRNRILNPALRADTTGYSFSGAGQVVTRAVITDLPGFTRAYHSALTDPPAGARIMYQMTGLSVGVPYTISLWVKNSNNASVATSSDNNAANFVVISAPAVRQSWTRVTGTFTAVATTHYLQIRQDGAGVGTAEQMMTGLLLEVGDTGPVPYFDGSVLPRLRQNRMLNPSPTAATGTSNWLNAGSGTASIVTGERGQNAVRQVRTANNAAIALYGQRNQPDMPVITPGETWTLSMTIRANRAIPGAGMTMGLIAANNTSYLADSSTVLNLTTEEQRFSVTYTVPADSTAAGMILSPRVGWLTTAGVIDDWIEVSEVLLEKTSQNRPFFDGNSADVGGDGYAWSGAADASSSYKYDLDLTTAWGGTADASVSRLNGVAAVGALSLSAIEVATVSTQHWSASGSRSVRMIPLGAAPSANSAAVLQILVGSAIPGEVYTAKVKMRLTQPQTGPLDPMARTIALSAGTGSYVSTPAPNEPGVHELTITGVVPAGPTTSLYVLVTNGATKGNGDIWIDDLILVKESYDGSYFDGSFPPVLDEHGEEIVRFAWTGAANASRSTSETRSSFEAPEGDATYLPYVDQYRRFLHSVRCISGPFTIAERESIDGRFLGRLVEFTLLAEVPWVFGVPKEIEIPPLTPTVMQDIAFNLMETPSMELATGTMVVATNYATNPSLEVDSSQWAGSVGTNSGASPNPYFTSGRVTGELAAAGLASMRGRILGDGSTTASGEARILLYMTQDITGIDPDSRPSFSVWAAGVSVGGATGAQIVSIRASVEIGTGDPTPDLILDMGTVTDPALISGHVFTAPSTELPAGVTEAAIYVIATVNWSSSATPASNSDIRIYADAVAITVP